jgi:hypothetical protein
MSTVGSATERTTDKALETRGWGKWADPLILFALGAFAVTQPILSDFRAGAGYFVARRNEPVEIVLLVLVLMLLPGLVANMVVWAAGGFSSKARRMAHQTMVGLFVALIVHTVLVRFTEIPSRLLILAALGGGILAVLAYNRFSGFRGFLTWIIPAPLIFALFFLLTPPVVGLVFPPNSPAAEADLESKTPVVFVVLDEFPVVSLLNLQGGVDATHYPNFARLASISTWHKYTAAAHDYTWWAVPPILTGEPADQSRLPTAANFPGNLFTLLDDSHALHVVEPFTRMCPPEACGQITPTSLTGRLRTLVADSGRLYQMALFPDDAGAINISDPFNEFRRGAAGIIEDAPTDHVGQFHEFVGGIEPGPQLHYIHLLLPHAPFGFYPSGTQYNNGVELAGRDADEVWLDPVLANLGYQRHLLQVQMIDGLLGELLDRLEALEILDDALIVVTSDHGTSFLPGEPRRALTNGNAYEVGLVPLFIKEPNQAQAEVDTTPARTMDVLPTVADILGIDIPWEHEGRTLRGQDGDPSSLIIQARSGEPITLDNVTDGVQVASERLHEVLGSVSGSLEPYSVGDFDSVIGTVVHDSQIQPSGLSASVDEAWRLAHVAPRTGFFVPGFLHGDLQGSVDPNVQVALAVNGEVRTVVPVFSIESGQARFNAIVPDEAFIAGFNDLRLYTVTGPPDSPVLASIELEGVTRFDMETASTGRVTRLVEADGSFWPASEEAPIEGSVDEGSWYETELQGVGPKDLFLNGWAYDTGVGRPPERLVFFVNGTFGGSTTPDTERGDIADAFGEEGALVSGFVGKLSHFTVSDSMDVRVFALSDGVAKELPITDDALADIAAG